MHVLWMSNSPISITGFGNVTRSVCSGLADLGHRVSILGWQVAGETRWPVKRPENWGNCQLYPMGHHRTGADVLAFYLRRLRPDVLITLYDIWPLPWMAHPLIAKAGIPRWLYYPLD